MVFLAIFVLGFRVDRLAGFRDGLAEVSIVHGVLGVVQLLWGNARLCPVALQMSKVGEQANYVVDR